MTFTLRLSTILVKDEKINNLSMRIVELENMYDASRVEYHNKVNEFKNMQK